MFYSIFTSVVCDLQGRLKGRTRGAREEKAVEKGPRGVRLKGNKLNVTFRLTGTVDTHESRRGACCLLRRPDYLKVIPSWLFSVV